METVNQEQIATQEQATEKTFTQAELDAVLAERLQRERSKYADYASLKQKAEAYDQSVEANKTELQKATDRAEALQAESLEGAEHGFGNIIDGHFVIGVLGQVFHGGLREMLLN